MEKQRKRSLTERVQSGEICVREVARVLWCLCVCHVRWGDRDILWRAKNVPIGAYYGNYCGISVIFYFNYSCSHKRISDSFPFYLNQYRIQVLFE